MICIAAAGKTVTLAAAAFTLSWVHSVERTRWEEDWRLDAGRLRLVEARVEGTGAGMEIPDGARREGTYWAYSPALPPQPRLVLASSGATRSGWTVCAGGRCLEVGASAGEPVTIAPCGAP